MQAVARRPRQWLCVDAPLSEVNVGGGMVGSDVGIVGSGKGTVGSGVSVGVGVGVL